MENHGKRLFIAPNIRQLTTVNNHLVVLSDSVSILDINLNVTMNFDIQMVDCCNNVFATSTCVYVLEDTLNVLIETSNITKIATWNNVLIIGKEGGDIDIYFHNQFACCLSIHSDDITSLLVLDDILISSSSDGTINLYNLTEFSQLQSLDENTIDEYLEEVITCNINVSVDYISVYKNQIYVATDMAQLSLWSFDGQLIKDYGHVQNINIDGYMCINILSIQNGNVYMCAHNNQHFKLFTFLCNEAALQPQKEYPQLEERINCLCLYNTAIVAGIDNGQIAIFE